MLREDHLKDVLLNLILSSGRRTILQRRGSWNEAGRSILGVTLRSDCLYYIKVWM